MASEVVIFVCETCRRAGEPEDAPRAGARLHGAVAAMPGAHEVRPVKCLSNCSRGPAAALVRADGWSYVFANLPEDGTGAALHEGARMLAGAADGVMPWRDRPEILKRNMAARVPPLALGRETAA